MGNTLDAHGAEIAGLTARIAGHDAAMREQQRINEAQADQIAGHDAAMTTLRAEHEERQRMNEELRAQLRH